MKLKNCMLSLVVTVLLLILFFVNYKKGIIVTAFLVQPLTYIGCGIGDISLYYFAAAISVLIVLISNMRKRIETYPKLLFIPTAMMAISYLITNAVSNHPNTILILGNILTQFIFPIALWCILDSRSWVWYAIKSIVCISVVAIIVMILELIFQHNYFTDFIQNNFVISDFVIDASTIRFGLKRTNSIFSYFSTFGTFCCLSTFVVWIVIILKLSTKKIYTCLMFLLPVAAFSTGSRAVFLAIFCILIGLFTQKKIMQKRLFKFAFCLCILLLPLIYSYFSVVVDSIINSDTTNTVSGSSSELRLLQWEICAPYFMQSPIWGNGRMYIWDEVAPSNPMLLGAESIWFSLLVDYGIMGAITYIIMIVGCILLVRQYNPRLIFMPIGYFLILFLSPDAGIQYNLLLTYVVLSVKIYLYSQEKSYKLALKQEI